MIIEANLRLEHMLLAKNEKLKLVLNKLTKGLKTLFGTIVALQIIYWFVTHEHNDYSRGEELYNEWLMENKRKNDYIRPDDAIIDASFRLKLENMTIDQFRKSLSKNVSKKYLNRMTDEDLEQIKFLIMTAIKQLR